MTHACKTCGLSAPAVKFSPQDGSTKPRKVCNLCRSIKDRAKRDVPKPSPVVGSAWTDLGADDRPDWTNFKRAGSQ